MIKFIMGTNVCLLIFVMLNVLEDLHIEAFVSRSASTFKTNRIQTQKPKTRRSMYLDFNDEPIIISQDKYNAVLKWAFENTTPPLTIQKSGVGHGHGLYFLQSVPPKRTIFTIPAEKCLTLQDSKSHPTLGESLEIMEDDLGDEFGPIAILSAYLASEMLREQCAEWEEDPSLGGLHGPYINVLPTGRAVSQQDHVLWWSEKEVNDLFTGGAAHEKATALREWVEEEGSIIEGMLVSDLAQKNMGLSISQGEL